MVCHHMWYRGSRLAWALVLCVALAASPRVRTVRATTAPGDAPNSAAGLPKQLSGYADGGVRRIEFEVPAGRDPVAVTTRVCARYAVEPSECQSVLAGVLDVHDAEQVRRRSHVVPRAAPRCGRGEFSIVTLALGRGGMCAPSLQGGYYAVSQQTTYEAAVIATGGDEQPITLLWGEDPKLATQRWCQALDMTEGDCAALVDVVMEATVAEWCVRHVACHPPAGLLSSPLPRHGSVRWRCVVIAQARASPPPQGVPWGAPLSGHVWRG